MIIHDVEGIDGAQIMIDVRRVDMLGTRVLIYQGECYLDGKPARYFDWTASGRVQRHKMQLRPGEYSAAGLRSLIAALEQEMRDKELVR